MNSDENKIKEKLQGYSPVRANQIQSIKPGDRVRYMVNNEFRGGGVVKLNKYPDYIVLLNVIKKVSWCMQLKDPTLKIWVAPAENFIQEREQKDKIFKLYKEGKLVKKK